MSILPLAGGCDRKSAATSPPPPPPAVTVSYPVRKTVTDWMEFSTHVRALESVRIQAKVEGFLQSVKFKPRSLVEENQLLFVIDPRPFQAKLDVSKARLAVAQASLKLSTTDLDRVTDLLKRGASTEYEKLTAEATLEKNQAEVLGCKADVEQSQLNLDYCYIRSPIRGMASRNLIDPGNLIQPGQNTVLTEVISIDPIYAYFTVSEDQVLSLMRMSGKNTAASQPATTPATPRTIPAYLGLSDEKGYPHEGVIDYYDTQLDPKTGTMEARAVFHNASHELVPGGYARIRIPIRTRETMLVSDIAVQSDQAGQYVLVVKADNVVEHRPVVAGATENQMRVIESGLTDKDRVIVNGVQKARPGAKVTPMK